jgi:hypothetical protein
LGRRQPARLAQERRGHLHRLALGPHLLTPALTPLAQGAYDDRLLPGGHLDPARLAVLADALEDAVGPGPELRGHLRAPGPHVRGCWALDLVLGKE